LPIWAKVNRGVNSSAHHSFKWLTAQSGFFP
jgi:hypothetical protein